MIKITINPYATVTQLVGYVPEAVVKHYGISCSNYGVLMPPGVLKHLKKRNHWADFMQYHADIPDMISNPDYAGQNPKEPDSIELYKVMNDHVLIAIKMNPTTGLFLGSFYTVNDGAKKIQARLGTGRIHPFSFFS